MFSKNFQKQQPQLTPVAPINNTTNNVTNSQPQPSTTGVTNHVATNKQNAANVPAVNRKPPIGNGKPSPSSMQSVAPTSAPQTSKTVPTPSPDKPKSNITTTPLTSTYTDPLEQSLARLENDIIKTDESMDNMSSVMVPMQPLINNAIANPNTGNPNLNVPILQQQDVGVDIANQTLNVTNVLPPNSMMHGVHSVNNEVPSVVPGSGVPPNVMHSNNNGLGIKEYDVNTNSNGLQGMGYPTNIPITSMFDPFPPSLNKRDPLIQPKPIKDLMDPLPNAVANDKKTTPEQKQSFNYKAPKHEQQNVKNASSWSSLAQANSPQNTGSGGNNSKQQVKDSFKAFQKQAMEKRDREKQRLENLEMKRQQKEQAEKERLRVENEKRREREEEDALEKAR